MKPKLLEQPNLDELREVCEGYIEEVSLGEVDDDTQHYIFEAAIEAFYGKDAWNWINGKL